MTKSNNCVHIGWLKKLRMRWFLCS